MKMYYAIYEINIQKKDIIMIILVIKNMDLIEQIFCFIKYPLINAYNL